MNVLDLYRARMGEPKLKGSANARGKEYCGPCPGCGGKDRFVMWPDAKGAGGGFTCRSCGCGGDAIQFLMDFDKLTFPQACDKLGVKLDPKAPTTPRLPRSLAPERFTPRVVEAPAEVWRAKAQILADHAHELLLKTLAQMEWLAARGITEATAVEHRLGWIAKDYYRSRESWGLETVLKDNGQPKRLWIPQGLTIPYAVDGQLRRVRIRKWVVRDADDPRYFVLPSAPAGAGMDTWLSREGASVYVVVESELDGLLVAQAAGDLVGVVALGSAKTKPDKRSARALSAAVLILVALDYDRAGAEAFWAAPKNQPEAAGWWPRNYPTSRRWMVPMGKDPGDYVRDYNGCVRSWVLAGLPPSMTVGRSLSGEEFPGEGRPPAESGAARSADSGGLSAVSVAPAAPRAPLPAWMPPGTSLEDLDEFDCGREPLVEMCGLMSSMRVAPRLFRRADSELLVLGLSRPSGDASNWPRLAALFFGPCLHVVLWLSSTTRLGFERSPGALMGSTEEGEEWGVAVAPQEEGLQFVGWTNLEALRGVRPAAGAGSATEVDGCAR